MRRMGTASEEELGQHFRLVDLVHNSPELVKELVLEEPGILESINNAAETALHWFAVENQIESVRLLYSLGASIPQYALIHAVQAGNLETVEFLLNVGADATNIDWEKKIENPIWKLSADTILKMYGLLEQFK